MDVGTLWEMARTAGPFGTAILFLLWIEERRERRQVQRQVMKMHKENRDLLHTIVAHVTDAHGSTTAESGKDSPHGR